ncbi:hypothetical protein LZ30DRAFT_542423, partial [Colletotrichum cereale]
YLRLVWTFRQEARGYVTLRMPKIHEQLGGYCRFMCLMSYRWLIVCKISSGWRDPQDYGEFVRNEHPPLEEDRKPDEHAKRRGILGQLYRRDKL